MFAFATLEAFVHFQTYLHLFQFALAVDVPPGCACVPMCVHTPLGIPLACAQPLSLVLA